MIFGLLILAVALFISAVAAFYSVTGLIAIFPGSVWAIIIMGGTLEVAKIAATVWLHKYWHRATIQFKLYLVPAIAVLMIITSMGIFGYLSASHLSQSASVGDITSQVQIFDEKIATERANIDANKKALTQMDSQVDQLLGRTTDDKGATKAAQLRKSQSRERKSLQNDISAAQKAIVAIQAERTPIASQARKATADVGPVLYIAALIYGDNPNADLLERAVRWVIILLVFVFDPLAIVLILAADQTFIWIKEDKQKKKEDEYELDDGQLTNEQLEQIKQESGINQDMKMTEEFFARGKELAKTIDDNNGHLPDNYASTQTYLQTPWVWPEKITNEGLVPKIETDPLDIPILEGEETWAQRVIDENKSADFAPDEYYDYLDGQPELDEQDIIDAADISEKTAMHRWKSEHPNSSLKLQRKLLERGLIDQLPWAEYLKPQPDITGYVQNAEQGTDTLWQRVKDSKKDQQ